MGTLLSINHNPFYNIISIVFLQHLNKDDLFFSSYVQLHSQTKLRAAKAILKFDSILTHRVTFNFKIHNSHSKVINGAY